MPHPRNAAASASRPIASTNIQSVPVTPRDSWRGPLTGVGTRGLGWAGLVALLTTGCADPTAPVRGPDASSEPARSATVGSGSPEAGFAFLPPLAPTSSPGATFDAEAAPRIEICALGPTGTCGRVVARMTFGGTGQDAIRLDPDGPQYVANWHTKRCVEAPCELDPAPRYRIRVLTAASGEIGSVEVRLAEAGKGRGGAVPADPGVAHTITNGSTLPIKFWIARPTLAWRSLSDGAGVPSGHTHTAYAPSLDAVFALVGGEDYAARALWRFDFAAQQWTQVPTTNFPFGKYRKLVYDASTGSLLTYWDGLGQAYRVPVTGGAWTPVGSSGNSDQYYVGGAFMNPLTNRLMQVAGYGWFRWHNRLWDLDHATGAWTELAQTGTLPWPRIGPTIALDASAAHLYLTEGEGNASGYQGDGGTLLDDLWRLDLRTRTWTNLVPIGGGSDNRIGSGMTYAAARHALFRFGGILNKDFAQRTNSLVRLDVGAAAPTWQPVTAGGAGPSARIGAGVFYDEARRRLVVVGGSTAASWVMDVWALSL